LLAIVSLSQRAEEGAVIRWLLNWMQGRQVRRFEIIIALLAEHGELYGLDIVKFSLGHVSRAQVYVDLAALEDRGLVAHRDTFVNAGTPRHVYRLVS
jgi:predicted transcriptional regulator